MSRETRLRERYPVPEDVLLEDACIIVDLHGKILCWYLPTLLNSNRQVSGPLIYNARSIFTWYQEIIWTAILQMESRFPGSTGQDGHSWRRNPENYKTPGTCIPHPGTVDLSPCWFQQGRDVSPMESSSCMLFKASQSPKFKPEISSSLKKLQPLSDMAIWLGNMLESSALLGALLRILHPKQFDACMKVLQELADSPEVVK